MVSVRIKLTEDIRKLMEQEQRDTERAVTRGIRLAAEGMKQELRQQAAPLGRKVSNSIRASHYPKSGNSLGAASLVFTKAPKLIRAFSDATLIRSKEGFFLAIPTDAAPKRGVGGKRISPSNFPEYSYGPLRFVYRGGGKPSLLVVDDQRARTGKRGGYARASKSAISKGNTATVVMFILVPQVRLRKIIDYTGTETKWHTRAPHLILQEFNDAGS